MGGQSWVVHVAHLLVSRGGQRVRDVVAKLPSPGIGSKGAGHAPGSSPDLAGEPGVPGIPSVPEASQSAAVFAETPVTAAEASTSGAGEAKDEPLDDDERTANTVGAEVAGTYGAHTGAADDPNVATSGPTGSEPVLPGDLPDDGPVTEADAPQTAIWPESETLSFTPDDSLSLVEDIEFSFEPEQPINRTPNASAGWVQGDGTRDCPDAFPIKGNGTSHIYHLPGQPSYAATIAELCFATEEAAAAEGYRPTRRNRPSS
jgi:hypothetical protein